MSMSSQSDSAARIADVYQGFRRIVLIHPEAIAIRHEGRSCSYAELDARASAVAHRLGFLRAQPSPSAVVVLLERDPVAEIAAILGVVCAGGVAVPLDASQLAARLRGVLENCAASAILASHRLLSKARELAAGATVIEIPEHGEPSLPIHDPIAPDSPAYVCYTSGSTGEPKGVVATRGQLAIRVQASVATQHFGPRDRHTLLHSLDVGAGCATLWRSLLTGGTLLPRRVKDHGVSGMRAWLEAEGATVLFCSPTLFRAFTATLEPTDRLTTLRMLRLGGERVLSHDFALFKRHLMPGAVFVNAYSITEASNVALHLLTHADEIAGDALPVGSPRGGCRISILDEDGHELPPGVTGEIVVEGPFLSSGYWRAPQSATTAFERVGDRPDVVRLRSGDLGHIGLDGLLYHTGRRDFQVKIRGFRVELEAIEATLQGAPGVTRCAVLVVRPPDGEPTLVAFIAADRRVTDENTLHAFALAHLPDGSVPARIRILESIPLTASGKVDRQALAALTELLPERAATTEWSLRSRGERLVAGIWRALLQHDRFGPDDDFMMVGGDSLLAMHVVARVQQQHGIAVELRDFLSAPTIVALGSRVDDRDGENLRLDEIELARLLDEVEADGSD
jgi:amino acid adenylation domain-containing protein